MIINNGAPVCEHFYSDFVDIVKDQNPNIYDTTYYLHVYSTSMYSFYTPEIDSDVACKNFLANVLNQIAIDGVAIVLVTNDFGKCVYIISSDD